MADVPNIPNTDRIADYTATAGQTVFNIPWVAIAASEDVAAGDIVVTIDDVVLVDPDMVFAGNAITGVSGVWNGGTLTLSNALTGGERVIIYSDREPQRTGSFLEGKSLPFSILDGLLDDVFVQLRDLSLLAKRAFRMSAANYLDGDDPAGVIEQMEELVGDASASATLASNWAQLINAFVTGTSQSAKEWAIGVYKRGVAGFGSSKDWATLLAATADNAEYSAKEYAVGVTVPAGSAKGWAVISQAAAATAVASVASIIQWAVAAGTADAITGAFPTTVTLLTDGLLLAFRASAANATTTPTFKADGTTAHTITKIGGGALLAKDIPAAAAEMLVRYNLANTRWELLNPANPRNQDVSTTGSPSFAGATISGSGNIAVGTGKITAGGTTGTALISAESSSGGSLSVVKTGVAEYLFKIDGSSNLNIGASGAPVFVNGSGQLTAGGAGSNFNAGVQIGAKSTTPTIAWLQSGVIEFDAIVNASNQWQLSSGTLGVLLDTSGSAFFGSKTDNDIGAGAPSHRYNTVYAVTGTINTSDATEKNWLQNGLTDAEFAAGKEIFAEIGGYQWLDAIAKKGDAARKHIGLRAQNVGAIITKHGLTPNTYGLFCYDQWPEIPAIPEVPATEEVPAVFEGTEGQDDYRMVSPVIPAQAAIAAISAVPAGSRYGLRPDELTYFLLAVLDKRLAALEAGAL